MVKKYRIDISAGSAESDIQNIFEFIELDSYQNAVKWYQNLKTKIQTLETMPERCPKAPENQLTDFKLYHLIVGNYRILYRIKDNTVQILHVRGPGQEYQL